MFFDELFTLHKHARRAAARSVGVPSQILIAVVAKLRRQGLGGREGRFTDVGRTIVSCGSSVEGVVQFFGDIVHSFQLSSTYAGDPIHFGYIVDPLREAQPAESRDPVFTNESIPIFDNQALGNDVHVQTAFQERLSRILESFYKRVRHDIVD